MDCNSLISWISLGVTILVALAGGIVFFKYDKRLKKQEKIINDQSKEINQYNLEEIRNKRRPNIIYLKAELVASDMPDYMKYRLYFENRGTTPAKNIRVALPLPEGTFHFDELHSVILGQASVSFYISIYEVYCTPENMNIAWDDVDGNTYRDDFPINF